MKKFLFTLFLLLGYTIPGVFAAGADDFVIKVQTNQVTSTDTTFTLPLNPSENYNFTVDWGDGQTEIITTNVSLTHTYANPGQYTIRITENVAGGFPQIYFDNNGNTPSVDTNAKKLRFIEQWGTIQWKSMQNAFFGTPNMKLNASDVPDLSRVTSMINMFRNGTSFEDLQDKIGTWNTSNVKHMRYTFFANSIFNEDISAWNTNNLESMNNMFDSALKFNQNLNNWNTSKVIQMYEMFHNAKDFNQPLSNWDVSKVTDMRYVFAGAEKFNQPLDTWNVGKVTDMKAMFNGAHAFNQDISMWDTSKVTNMWWMFEDARTFNQDISSWNVEKVTDMTKMFALARAFNQDL